MIYYTNGFVFHRSFSIFYLVSLPPGSKYGEIPSVPKVTRPKFVISRFPMALSSGAGTLVYVE